jgi:hypothetical protein
MERMKIKNKENALALFEINAINHAEATEEGNYKEGNKCYKLIHASKNYLEAIGELSSLSIMLNHSSVGPRMWAASYLLPLIEGEAEKVLKNIISERGIHSLTAETTLNEWHSGKLKL